MSTFIGGWDQFKVSKLHKTQFQIKGGGLVQGVTKCIPTFSAKVTPLKNYDSRVYNKYS